MEKVEFLLATVIISLISTGFHIATRDDFVLAVPRAKVQSFMDRIFGKKLSFQLQKPIFECSICMSSFWTIILFWFFGINILYLPLLILAVCTLNTIITMIIKDIL